MHSLTPAPLPLPRCGEGGPSLAELHGAGCSSSVLPGRVPRPALLAANAEEHPALIGPSHQNSRSLQGDCPIPRRLAGLSGFCWTRSANGLRLTYIVVKLWCWVWDLHIQTSWCIKVCRFINWKEKKHSAVSNATVVSTSKLDYKYYNQYIINSLHCLFKARLKPKTASFYAPYKSSPNESTKMNSSRCLLLCVHTKRAGATGSHTKWTYRCVSERKRATSFDLSRHTFALYRRARSREFVARKIRSSSNIWTLTRISRDDSQSAFNSVATESRV